MNQQVPELPLGTRNYLARIQLITTAPEMLETMKNVLEHLVQRKIIGVTTCKNDLMKIIAKAESCKPIPRRIS